MFKKFTFIDQYEANIILNDPANQVKTQVFRGNSPYDPDYTAGIFQKSANGWKNFSNLYRRYYCMASKITIMADVIGNASDFPKVDLGVVANQDFFVGATDIDRYRSFPLGSWGQIAQSNQRWTSSNVTNYSSFRRVIGKMDDQANLSDWSANPPRPWYWNVMIGSSYIPTGVTIPIKILYKVKIIYYVKMMDMQFPQV